MSDDPKNPVDAEIKDLRQPLLGEKDMAELILREFDTQDEGAEHVEDELAKQKVWQGLGAKVKGPRPDQRLVIPGLLALAAAVVLIVFLGDRVAEDDLPKSGEPLGLTFELNPLMVDAEGEISMIPADEPPSDVAMVFSVQPDADGFASLIGIRRGQADLLLTEVAVQAHSDELLGEGEDAYIFEQNEADPFSHLCVIVKSSLAELGSSVQAWQREPLRSMQQGQCIRLGLTQ